MLEFVWQHYEVSEVHTIAMPKRALHNILSPTLLPSGIRGLVFFARLKCLVVPGRMTDPSHWCPNLELPAKGSVKESEIDGWKSWISSECWKKRMFEPTI